MLVVGFWCLIAEGGEAGGLPVPPLREPEVRSRGEDYPGYLPKVQASGGTWGSAGAFPGSGRLRKWC